MDTARARNALPSKNPEIVPRLNEIATEGVEFTNATSTAPWTLPSHTSMFTGQYTHDHGTNAGNKHFNPDYDPLARQAKNAGYRTVAFSNNTWISPEFGFDAGFDQFYNCWKLFEAGDDLPSHLSNLSSPLAKFRELLKSTSPSSLPATVANAAFNRFVRKEYDYGAAVTNWKIKRWLKNELTNNDPFFMFVNYLEPHLEYDPPKKFGRKFLPDGVSLSEAENIEQEAWRYVAGDLELTEKEFEILEGLYNAELHYLDYRIGQLYDFLSDNGILENTLLIVTGDHGENIGDHGLMDHQYCLYDTLVHVPLIMRGPGQFSNQSSVDSVVELRDLYPTLLNVMDIEPPERDSISDDLLTPRADDKHEEKRYAISEYLVPQPDTTVLQKFTNDERSLDRFNCAIRSIRTDQWKFLERSNGRDELYALTDDPLESENRLAKNQDVADGLKMRLHSECGPLAQGNQDSEELESSAKQRLEDLGYI